MSREEAAMVYLDGLLGFRRDYLLLRQATDVLSEKDRYVMEEAVTDGLQAIQSSKRQQ